MQLGTSIMRREPTQKKVILATICEVCHQDGGIYFHNHYCYFVKYIKENVNNKVVSLSEEELAQALSFKIIKKIVVLETL